MRKLFLVLIMSTGLSNIFAMSSTDICEYRAGLVASFASGRDQGKSKKQMEKEVKIQFKKLGVTYEKTGMKDYMDAVYLEPTMNSETFYKFVKLQCLQDK